MIYNVTLKVPVKLTATCHIKVAAENEDQAWDRAMDVYAGLVENDEAAMKAYRQDKAPYPEKYNIVWDVDNQDIESNMNEREIEVDRVEPGE